MKLSSIIILLVITIFFFSACNIINPEEKIPTYVHIDSFQFVPTLATGTSSHKITSVWAYLNGILLGSFDIPGTIPVLLEKQGKFLVLPGITYSGLSDVQTIYPFYRGDTMTLIPKPGQLITYTPKTQYVDSSTLYILNEDFEFGNGFTKIDGDTALTRVSDTNLVFEGKYAGYIYLDNKSISENIMSAPFTTGPGTFLELNYRGSLPFEIGLQSENSAGQLFIQYFFGYRPRADWNKVYIGLQDFIQTYPGKSYRVVVRVVADSPTQGFVSFDNFKVITSK